MTLRALVPALLLTPLVAARATADDGLRPGETVRETDAVYPGAVPEDDDGLPTLWPVRIVDAWTGKPIPGATVRVPEHGAGDGAAPQDMYDLCSGTADKDGWVRLPWKQAMGWRDYILADAPGYAPNEYCDLGSKSCALSPGADVPIVLRDYTGRTVAGARVALNLCCQHISDQRESATDAAGRAVLRSIRPQEAQRNAACIWLEAPRLHRGTAILGTVWRPGDPPVPIYGAPGVVVAGTVIGPDGKPRENAVVGAHGQGRPWMRTGADGRFRLVGVTPWTQIDLYPKYGSDEPMTWFFAPPEGVERTVTLGAPNSGVALKVTLRGPSGEAAEGARIVVVRPLDGLTAPRVSDASGAGEFSLPAGHYEVVAGDDLGPWNAARGTVDLRDGEPAALSLAVTPRPTVRIDASRLKGVKVKLCTAREERDIDPQAIDGRDVPVPADEPAAFFVWGHEDRELLVHVVEVPPPGPAREKPLVLDWVPATRVTARLCGPEGAPVEGRLTIERERGAPERDSTRPGTTGTATPAAETHLTGTVDWVAVPNDKGLGPSSGTIRITEAGKPVDLGEIRLRPAFGRVFRVEIPKDTPTDGVMATVTVRRTSYLWTGIIGKDGTLDADVPWIGPGEVVTVSIPGNLAPCELRVAGPPPWIAKWPRTSLTVHATDETGNDISGASVLLDDPVVTWETTGAGALLLGVRPGPHEVVVAADGCRAKIVTLTLAEDDPREIRVRLSARR